jgi:hypothetical protein
MLFLEDREIGMHTSTDLSENEVVALIYHSIFNYPLNQAEMIRWLVGEKTLKIFDREKIQKGGLQIKWNKGFYFLGNQEALVFQRLLKKRVGDKKKAIATKAAFIISLIPSVKFIGLTGALAMDNSDENSDIDLMLITHKGTLWTTRLMSYLILKLSGMKLRKYEKNPRAEGQKDKLCLNMWLDEQDLVWRKNRNLFTAHEIAQIKPLVNKDNAYEKLIYKNKWIKKYWPNAVVIRRQETKVGNQKSPFLLIRQGFWKFFLLFIRILEPLAYGFQKLYMKKKVTREIVTPTRAIFHRIDWGQIVTSRLKILLA